MDNKFSDRIGATVPTNILQLHTMAAGLRNLLWNSFDLYYLAESKADSSYTSLKNSYLYALGINLWMYFFKSTIDSLPSSEERFVGALRNYFFDAQWYDVYNFLEFCIKYSEEANVDKKKFAAFTNEILKQELSGYRIIGDCFAPITNDEQIKSIDDSISLSKEHNLDGVLTHINASLEILANKELKDVDRYRNSIKESISAVEALCNKLNSKKSDGLKGALNSLNKKIVIHGALEAGFIKLYGYTSDEQGIRHTIMDEPNLDIEDAIYMMVTCSAFINYLIQKAAKCGLL